MTAEWRQATEQGDLAAIARLLDSGSDIDARDERGQTALMNAARDGRTEVVRLLAAGGARLDHTAKFGLTALMLSVIRDQVDTARVLIDAGADLSVRGTGAPGFHGKTARDLAMERDSEPMKNLFRRSVSGG
jgi:ankyrin repeat protein